jgi:hypothetical protein
MASRRLVIAALYGIEHYWANLKAWLRKFIASVLPIAIQIGRYFWLKVQPA